MLVVAISNPKQGKGIVKLSLEVILDKDCKLLRPIAQPA